MATGQSRLKLGLLISFFALFVWSAINPRDRLTWFLEVAPAIVALMLLVMTYRRFQFTSLAYCLIWCHAVILLVGGHYTYAEVPLFNWIRDQFHLSRNYYDRIGHLAQGFCPAIVAREILMRSSPLGRGKWLFLLTTCVCLAISAAYELTEWAVALATGQKADAFLGTQGDTWDTQWDMFLALCGCLLAQTALSRLHDRQVGETTAA